MIYAVFDTNVILQGILRATGPAGACIQAVSDRKCQLIITERIISEIQSVISRPKLIGKYEQLRGKRPDLFLSKIRKQASVVTSPPRIYDFQRDPTDEIFINLALANNPDYLVSRDRDLLDLRSDSTFSSQFPNLKIVTPVGFLEIVRAT